jgi:hypothetical protein
MGPEHELLQCHHEEVHQSWIDDQGQTAELDGEFRDGGMRLEGCREGPKGTRVAARLTLTPPPDGSVSQVGEDSGDAGKTWTPLSTT